MIDPEEYISIAEFAKLAGVTPRAVYKRINKPVHEPDENQFAKYIELVDGKKRISTNALEQFDTYRREPVHEPVPEPCEQVHEPVPEPSENQILTILQETLDTLKENMDVLKGELTFKNTQLENKDARIEELTKELKEANSRLNDRWRETNYITAVGQQPKQIEDNPVEPAPEPVKKRHFWDWFKKKED